MTALISAMNKRAVALAADSAITIGDSSNHKVLNCANKLFNLSSAHSVGVMICGGASYMGLPWEVIIKEFGKSLGDTPLPNLNDYKEQFLSYLKNNNHFCKREWQIENLISELSRLYRINTNSSSPSASQEELKDSFIQKTDEITNDPIEDVEGLNGYPFEDFMMEFGSDIEPKAESFPLIKTYPELNEKFLRCFHKFLLRNNSLLGISKSQIVFTGYGSTEIMPQLTSFSIWLGFDNHIRYDKYIDQSVTEENNATISSYAQTDIINTFIYGIHPKLNQSISDNIPGLLSKTIDQLATTFSEPEIQEKIRKFDRARANKLFVDLIDRNSREQFTNPLIATIGNLDIPDLISFVESLISLTGLHRRMVGIEEGVGGPVDVAVITKSDGFAWVKHKTFY